MKMSQYKILRNSTIISGSICGILALKQSLIFDNIRRTECETSVTKTDDIEKQSSLKLKQVQLFYRHGARTPLHTIPNVDEANYDNNVFMAQVPHTHYNHKELSVEGGSRQISSYEKYLTTRPKLKATYEPRILLVPVPHTKFQYKARDIATGGGRPDSGYDNYYAKHILKIIIKLTGNKDRHEISEEFKFWSPPLIDRRYLPLSTGKNVVDKGGSQVGALTQLGQEQMYVIGRELRKQYIDRLKFIDAEYNPSQVYVRSTNIHRTIGTARCILAGLYGKKHLDSLEDPLVIHVKHSFVDELLPRPAACKVLRQINHASMIHGADHPDIKDDRVVLENVLGLPPDYTDVKKKKLNFVEVRDDVSAREAHGFKVPEILIPHLDMIEKNANLLMYFAFCGQHEAERMLAMRLSNGPLLRMLFETIENRTDSSPRFYIYSCHDSTLVALVASLGFYDNRWPPFGADVRFELYEDVDKNEFIKVSYCGETKKVRGCKSELCPVEDFKEAIKPYAIDDQEYREVCSSNILDIIAKEMMEQEKGEVEDTETKEKSDIAAGM